MRSLSPQQRKALAYIKETTRPRNLEVQKTIKTILEETGLQETDYEEAIQSIQKYARVVLHFHPDRLSKAGIKVAEGFFQEGVYKNQFETGLSNGSTR